MIPLEPVTPGSATELPAPTPAADEVFGAQLHLANEFAGMLVRDGVRRGLIGPREAEAIWDRHLVNCALVASLLPPRARVVDVGSGAGLPGLAIAIVRPDLTVDLVEPLLRRSSFLSEAVAALSLVDRVRVVRGRAEEPAVRQAVGGADWVTARAVAPLPRLVRWCLPLVRRGGTVLALKGARAEDEIKDGRPEIERLGGRIDGIRELTAGGETARVVVVTKVEGSKRAGAAVRGRTR